MRRFWPSGPFAMLLVACGIAACSGPPTQPAPADPADIEQFRLRAATREAARVEYAEGVYLREMGKPRAALERFSDAVRLDPEDPLLRLALTQQYLQLGAVDEATALLREFETRFPLAAEEHLLAARLDVVSGREAEAYRHVDAALAADASLVDAWYVRGRMLLDDGRLNEALQALQAAERLEPYRAATQLRLAECYARLGERQKAEAKYRTAIELDTRLQAARTALATLYREDGRLDEAIAVYRDILELEPSHEATFSTLLEVLLDTRRYEDAAELLAPRFEEGVLDPRQQYIYGWITLQLGDLDHAERVLTPLTDLPAARGVEALLGEVELRRGRPDVAREHFQRAVDKRPDECSTYVSLAGAMIEELREDDGRLDLDGARLDAVREVLTSATEITPAEDERCNVLLGIAYSQLRDFESALHHFEASYRLNSQNANVVFNMAMAHQELGHFETALQLGRDALVLEPDNPAALNFVGYILAERGLELADSEQLIRRALEAEPDNGYYVDSLGWVFYQRGQYAQAAVELERAVALTDNKDPIILEHLGDAYVKMGQLDGAYRAYEQSRELQPSNPGLLEKIHDLQKRLGEP